MEQYAEISGLSKLLQENGVMILGKHEKYTEYDVINMILEEHNQNASFYIVDLGEIVRRYKQWTKLLPSVKPFYAVKCNPNIVICKLMALLGSGFDVASKNEINIVKNLVDYGNVIYAHPYKDCASLQYARAADIDFSVFDSTYELDKIKVFHPFCKLLLRIKVDDSQSQCKFSTKFGADSSDLSNIDKIIHHAKALNLIIVGVSFHVGSDCENPAQFYEAIKLAREIFKIGEKHNFTMNVLDIGGGFSRRRGSEQDRLFELSCENINKSLTEFFGDIPELKVIAEPGRYFVQSSHTLVVNVIGKNMKINKETGVQEFIYYMNDGVYGSFNCIFFDHQKPDIQPYNERFEEKKYKSTIFGRTCDSIDKITDDIQLPQLEIDDYCFVPNFGAYTAASSTTFNGFPAIKSYYVMTS
jgi:ornithine decarboxylase